MAGRAGSIAGFCNIGFVPLKHLGVGYSRGNRLFDLVSQRDCQFSDRAHSVDVRKVCLSASGQRPNKNSLSRSHAVAQRVRQLSSLDTPRWTESEKTFRLLLASYHDR